MDGKLRVLFYNLDGAGVNYFRTQTPAMVLERDFNDDFHVEVNPQIDFNDPETIEYLKSFHIIHYHRQLHPNTREMVKIAKILKENGTILVIDIDDYWHLHTKHPLYSLSVEKQMHVPIIENLKIADYVTTTTELFSEKIKEVTGKDNVIVLYNAVDPDIMKQFRNKWKPDPNGRVRITYMGGSSHMGDVEQLQTVTNVLYNDPQLKDKFKIILAGWDSQGSTTEIKFNQEFGKELQVMGLWNQEVVKIINKTKGNVDSIPQLPQEMKDKYRGKVFESNKRDIKSEESVYLLYEKILTDNHRIVKNEDYLNWLMNFERNVKYPDELNFGRRWTQKANMYATTLDETDIAIAPLADNEFNKMKCVVGNTLINTNKGIFKIGDIVNNKMKLKINGHNIINWFKYENEKTIKLISDYGVEIEGTKTHRILVDNEWVKLKDINIGDKIKINCFDVENNEYQKIRYPLLLTKGVTKCIINQTNDEMLPEITINEDYGRFFGYMLGGGSFSRGYLRITCDKRHSNVVNDVTNLVRGMGLNPTFIEKKPDNRCENSLVKDGFGLDIHIPSKHLSDICVKENLKNDKGKVFEIPKFILKSPKSVIAEFLKGLFESDGSVNLMSSNISLTTKSEILAKQVQFLLMGFGILSKTSKTYNKSYKRHYYVVRLNREATDLYVKYIGFVSKHKIDALDEIVNKSHSNRFKSEDYYITITNIIENTDDVYDIEVDEIHKYNGNGIINHNSNLKQVECWSRKLPIVSSDIPPYNVDGRHMENCVLISNKKNAHKYWKKYLKQLILDADLRKKLGEQLYEDFKDKYNLKTVTKKRANFYKEVVLKSIAVS